MDESSQELMERIAAMVVGYRAALVKMGIAEDLADQMALDMNRIQWTSLLAGATALNLHAMQSGGK